MPLGCVCVRKGSNKLADSGLPSTLPRLPSSLKVRVRSIQLAKRFINCINPKCRCLYLDYGNEEELVQTDVDEVHSACSSTMTSDLGSAFILFRNEAMQSIGPMSMPSSILSSRPNCHKLPHPPFPKVSPSCQVEQYGAKSAGNPMQPFAQNAGIIRSVTREIAPGLISFTYNELLAAPVKSSPDGFDEHSGVTSTYIHKIIKGDSKGEQKDVEVTVTPVCDRSAKGFTDWLVELSIIARLHSSYLCKIIGFCAEEQRSRNRLLVYERLAKGGLDKLLYGRTNSLALDWLSRMKIALGAAHGLAYLHATNMHLVGYGVFKTSNIEVDINFSSKLTGYGFANCTTYQCIYEPTYEEMAYRAPETRNPEHLLRPEANVWSFGIVLLELLTGRQNMKERDLVKWTEPFLVEENRIFMMMDPKLQGRFPAKGGKMIADLVSQCVHRNPSERPTMREVADMLKIVYGMRYTSFP